MNQELQFYVYMLSTFLAVRMGDLIYTHTNVVARITAVRTRYMAAQLPSIDSTPAEAAPVAVVVTVVESVAPVAAHSVKVESLPVVAGPVPVATVALPVVEVLAASALAVASPVSITTLGARNATVLSQTAPGTLYALFILIVAGRHLLYVAVALADRIRLTFPFSINLQCVALPSPPRYSSSYQYVPRSL